MTPINNNSSQLRQSQENDNEKFSDEESEGGAFNAQSTDESLCIIEIDNTDGNPTAEDFNVDPCYRGRFN